MVSDTHKPTKKGKTTSVAELNKIAYSLKTQKDARRLQKTSPVKILYQKTPKDSKNHGKWQSSSTSDGLDQRCRVTQKIYGMEGGGRIRVRMIPIKQGQLCEI